MTAEIGHYALVLALGLTLVQGTLPLWGAARGDASLMALARSTGVPLKSFRSLEHLWEGPAPLAAITQHKFRDINLRFRYYSIQH